ncbi:MAG: A24 family peptidase C-terminal domain-containing protein [Methanoregula sp.]|jgi:preflagellin peptidase FlaK
METFYPMVISAIAVLITLLYASYLDIRDRRVPFIYWLPMLAVGICCTGAMLWQTSGNAGLIVGYISLVASFLYADYLDNRGRTDSPGLTYYYRKGSIFYYLAFVLLLPAVSWFLLAPSVNMQLVFGYAVFAAIFLYVTWMEYTGKFDEPETPLRKGPSVTDAIGRWYFILIILIYAISSITLISGRAWTLNEGLFVLMPAVFAGVFYTFGRMHLFGGADAWALIFIAFCVPTFPFTPILGIPPLGFLAFSALINALLLNLAAPIAIFVINLVRGNRAPLMYMFFGFPVRGDEIQKEWGFVMEDFGEKNGAVERKFIGFWDAIHRMYTGVGRVYTKDLREQPEKFKKELTIYRKAGTVWISYAVPFIIPIMAGFVTAIIFGDFLLAVMTMITGG